MTAFWVLSPFMVVAALGMLFVRKAVHCALLLAFVMIALAVLYVVQDAPFLFAVQIIVYTGAILMLFLFVLMLVGVDSSDSLIETIPGQRIAATVVGVLFTLTMVVALTQVSLGVTTGLTQANSGGNVEGIAEVLFSKYVLAFEVTSALLITAAIGAMVLAHRERLTPKLTQADIAAQRVRDYADSGKHLGPLPPPGTYARHNAVDTPALLPDGSPSELSVSRVLVARGQERTAPAHDIDPIEGVLWDADPAGGSGGAATPQTSIATLAGTPAIADTNPAEDDGGAAGAINTEEQAVLPIETEPVRADEWEGSARRNPDNSMPEGFPIKGNKNSMLYHAPDGRWYDVTVAEVWFATEEAALKAGFAKAGSGKKRKDS